MGGWKEASEGAEDEIRVEGRGDKTVRRCQGLVVRSG